MTSCKYAEAWWIVAAPWQQSLSSNWVLVKICHRTRALPILDPSARGDKCEASRRASKYCDQLYHCNPLHQQKPLGPHTPSSHEYLSVYLAASAASMAFPGLPVLAKGTVVSPLLMTGAVSPGSDTAAGWQVSTARCKCFVVDTYRRELRPRERRGRRKRRQRSTSF